MKRVVFAYQSLHCAQLELDIAVGAPPRICLPAGWMSLLDIQSLFLHLQVHKVSITNGVKRTIKPTFGHLKGFSGYLVAVPGI